MADLNKIIEELSTLTVVEAAELSKQLEEKWGVTPVAAAAPAAAGGAAAAEDKDEFTFGLVEEIEIISRTFKVGSKQQEHNLIDALKIACRKFSKERTGKKPFTNINLVRI